MEVYWNEKLKVPNKENFRRFLEGMSVRIAQGHARYGPPDRRKLYLKRARMELSAYRKTGNHEHLLNAANYCWLESMTPSNTKYHFDNRVRSATRGKI